MADLILGFTGTRQGMTTRQRTVLLEKLNFLRPDEAHLGDCIGADEQARQMIQRLGDIRTVGHPPIKPKYRAFGAFDLLLPEKEYIARDYDIVDASGVVIGCPNQEDEQVRSGTWTTIRYAKKKNKMVFVIHPDGSVVEYGV